MSAPVPGDWWLLPNEIANGCFLVRAGDERPRIVAEVDPDGFIEDENGREMVLATARLIKAAPKLLEALSALMRDDLHSRANLDRALVALAEAEGR